MLGTSLQFARSNADDRFCNAAKARRNSPRSRIAAAAADSGGSTAFYEKVSPSDRPEPENRVESPTIFSNSSPLTSFLDRSSNLDRFLESTTPSVPALYLSKMGVMGWRSCDEECNRPYFVLGDVWESFKEWSAYGAGVPLVLNGSDCVVQYYVPYLSAIQLYREMSSCREANDSRRAGEDSDIDCYRDSSSDGSSDCEPERGVQYVRDWCQNHAISSSNLGINGLSMRDTTIQEGFSSDDSDAGNSQSCLLFQYLEHDPPYCREPLTDKVSQFTRQFPELRTLRSCDLLPSSWLSVAWYPIYRIPTGPSLKDLDACFLTFHSLSTSMRGTGSASEPTVNFAEGVNGVRKLYVPSFGLASYKFKSSLWTPTVGCEKQLASSLLQAADSWLQLLSVDHPDYRFFTSHGAFRR